MREPDFHKTLRKLARALDEDDHKALRDAAREVITGLDSYTRYLTTLVPGDPAEDRRHGRGVPKVH